MPVALIVAVVAALAAWLAFAAWQGRLLTRALDHRRCTRCGEGLVALTEGPVSGPVTVPGAVIRGETPRSYEVHACPACTSVVTTVHGTRSAFAYCPSCRQLALQLTPYVEGAVQDGGEPPVRIEEDCQICGYRGELVLGGAAEVDNVIPFRPR